MLTILLHANYAILPLIAGLIGSGVISGIESLVGAKKSKQAQDILNTPMPTYTIPQNEYANQSLAESLAAQGMSQGAKDEYQAQADRGLSATLGAIVKGGGSVNNVGNVYDQYNNDISKFALYEDQAKMRNLANLMAQNERMSSFLDKSYQLNEYAPWANKMQMAAQLKSQGDQMTWQGLGGVGSAIADIGSDLQKQLDTNKMWDYVKSLNKNKTSSQSDNVPQGWTFNPGTGSFNPGPINSANIPDWQRSILYKTLLGG